MCCVSGSPCLSVLWGPLLVSHGHHAAHTQRGEVPGCHRVHVLEGKLVWGFPGQVPAAPGHRTRGVGAEDRGNCPGQCWGLRLQRDL